MPRRRLGSSSSLQELPPNRVAADEPLRAEDTPATLRRSPPRGRTNRASSRLVSPGTAFCSSSIVGMPRSAAIGDDRPRAVPADADHDVRARGGDDAPRIEPRRAAQRGPARRADERLALQSRAANQIERELRRAESRGPRCPRRFRQTRSAHRACRAFNARATASPGNRCPPVPPPAITTRMQLSPPLIDSRSCRCERAGTH